LLIFFLDLVWIFRRAVKSPPAMVAGGLGCLDLSGRFLIQAIAVRRHGESMMVVVVTVMAAALHLFKTLRANTRWCQLRAGGKNGD
jgi:hypothetical protein